MGGVAWQGLSYLIGKFLVLASTVILARLLTPHAFGLVALALAFITYAEVFTDLGVAQALVFFPADRRRNDVAVVVSIVMSALLTMGALIAAPLVGSFFHRPDVVPMFRVLSLSLLLEGLGQVPDALLRRELRFRRRLIPTLVRTGFQGILSVILAALGLGPWSIVYGFLAGALLWTVTSWLLVSYRPSLRSGLRGSHDSRVRQLLGYGVPAAMHGLVVSLLFDIDYLIVGRVLGATALGTYSLAFRVPELLIINVFYVISTVAFPLFSRARHDPAQLRRGYLTSLRAQTVYGVGAGVGLAIVAPMLVHVIFGPKWNASIVPLQALGLYAAFRSLGNSATDVYKGIGRPGLAFAVSLIRLTVLVPALIVAAQFGIDQVSWTQMVAALVFAALMQVIATRLVGVSARAFLAALLPSLCMAAGTALCAGLVRLFFPGPEAIRLVVAAIAGLVGGVGAVWLVDRRFVNEMRGLLSRRITAGRVMP